MSFTHLHMSMATKQQLVKLFAASSAGAVPGCWLWRGNKEMSGADFLHPTAEGKLERKGISLLKQDAQDSFSERREIPCISHLSPCTVTYCWPPPKAVPPLLVHLLTKQAGVWQKTGCIMNAVGEAAAAPQHTGTQRDYGVSWPLDLVCWFIFFPQNTENFFSFSMCYGLVEGKDTGELYCLFWRCVFCCLQLRDMELTFCCSFPLFLRNNSPLDCSIYKT